MAASYVVTYQSILTVVETLDPTTTPDAVLAASTINHSGFNTGPLAMPGVQPATASASFSKAMTAGAATIDLTALSGTNGATVNMTGLQVRACKFANPATNANPITVKFGASNPYNLLGASWQIILQPGQEILLYLAALAPTVAGGAKNIDISGTGTQALNCIIVAG